MTSWAATSAATIQVIIHSEHLAMEQGEGWHETQDWGSLRQAVTDALEVELPDAPVEVEIRHLVVGAGCGTWVFDEDGAVMPEETRQAEAVVNEAIELWMWTAMEAGCELDPGSAEPGDFAGAVELDGEVFPLAELIPQLG
ncbi:MAG: hypothetical protein QM765_29390 [Myxococcales bacterium]